MLTRLGNRGECWRTTSIIAISTRGGEWVALEPEYTKIYQNVHYFILFKVGYSVGYYVGLYVGFYVGFCIGFHDILFHFTSSSFLFVLFFVTVFYYVFTHVCIYCLNMILFHVFYLCILFMYFIYEVCILFYFTAYFIYFTKYFSLFYSTTYCFILYFILCCT